ncbi:MAG: histidinol-phosphate transaminase [Candidatus Magnetobacterium sp. LHC-1]|uniref:Histidinol-phosphate aminotransferase n=1 Tax=Candidatus Magnetobacterium casense TaxID=1455061 RepID=A0ABS6S2E7_9BACT|nr:histidinol-phosphate transaminase [Candidatus Magnetobacterium casensis]MBF0607798.1 histidinol-phosphate transaminase [Nitrospirota bacterium]MBV6342579.1 histidinol-phosphate transaminase [Candidatus Magnetobacterium casensis]
MRANIRQLRPYSAVEIPCRIKLDANEAPYGLVPGPIAVDTNRYPDPEARELRNHLAHTLNVDAENILLGNGSDEVIYHLITSLGGPVLYPMPTFVMYGIIAQTLGETSVAVPLGDDFDLDTNAMTEAIRRHNPKVIFMSSPNNPTGNSFNRETILEILSLSRGIVVIDEAYQPYSPRPSVVPMISRYNNLYVMRTLSKVGLAALRVGFLVGAAEGIEELNKVRLPYNVNALSQRMALMALQDGRLTEQNTKTVIAERQRLFEGLSRLDGITAYPSDANFILIKTANAKTLHQRLLQSGILLKDMTSALENCLRITIGRPEENTELLKAMAEARGTTL